MLSQEGEKTVRGENAVERMVVVTTYSVGVVVRISSFKTISYLENCGSKTKAVRS